MIEERIAAIHITHQALAQHLDLPKGFRILFCAPDPISRTIRVVVESNILDQVNENAEPPLFMLEAIEKYKLYGGGDCNVPVYTAQCPECGNSLIAQCDEWETDTERPINILIACKDDEKCNHKYTQDLWQGVNNSVYRWAGATPV